VQCIQFYLNNPQKIDPPMNNVTKRSLQAEMGDAFMGWADAFFSTVDTSPGTLESFPKYLDNYFSKEMAFDDFLKATQLRKWTVNKFKKAIKAYCQFNNYILNPKDLLNSKGRIVQKIDNKTQEVLYIRTIQLEVESTSDVKEYDSEEDIFNE
jgi:hypothetical protein